MLPPTTRFQQIVLLVGAAYLWKIVRGKRKESQGISTRIGHVKLPPQRYPPLIRHKNTAKGGGDSGGH